MVDELRPTLALLPLNSLRILNPFRAAEVAQVPRVLAGLSLWLSLAPESVLDWLLLKSKVAVWNSFGDKCQ